MRVGTVKPKDLKIGTDLVQKVYVGTSVTWLRVTNITNFRVTSTEGTKAHFAWTNGINSTAKDIYQKLSSQPDTSYTLKGSFFTNAETYTVNSLQPETSYDFKIVSRNSYHEVTSTVVTAVTTKVIIRPISDISIGDWTLAPLFSKINDESDATFISSTNNNGSTATVSLGTSPMVSSNAILYITRKKGAGQRDPDFLWEILEDGVIVQSNSLTITSLTFLETVNPITFTFQMGRTYEFRMTRSGGGNPTQRASIDMGGVRIELW